MEWFSPPRESILNNVFYEVSRGGGVGETSSARASETLVLPLKSREEILFPLLESCIEKNA